MYLLTGLTSNTLQRQRLILPNGDPIILVIEFKPLQFGWFIRQLTYELKDFELRGMRINTGPNILYQFKNILRFGMACITKQNREPSLQEDFSSGNSQLYILSESETEELAGYFSGQTQP